MDNTEIFEEKLGSVEHLAGGLRVVGIVCTVLCALLVGVAALLALRQLPQGAAVAGQAFLERAGGAVSLGVMAWLARRGADAFTAVAALIREMREIV